MPSCYRFHAFGSARFVRLSVSPVTSVLTRLTRRPLSIILQLCFSVICAASSDTHSDIIQNIQLALSAFLAVSTCAFDLTHSSIILQLCLPLISLAWPYTLHARRDQKPKELTDFKLNPFTPSTTQLLCRDCLFFRKKRVKEYSSHKDHFL